GDDAVDVLVVEKLLIFSRGGEFGIVGDFASQGVAPVVQIGGGDAFDARKRNCSTEQARALHANADDSEAHLVARGNVRRTRWDGVGVDDQLWRYGCRASDSRGALDELTASEVFFHGSLLWNEN